MSTRFDQLLALIPSAIWETFHVRARRILIQIEGEDEPLSFPVARIPPVGPAEPAEGGHVSQCDLDILDVIRAAGRPMTRTAILSEMTRQGKEWSERTVAGSLARMVQDGTLDNPNSGTPRGYRLPE